VLLLLTPVLLPSATRSAAAHVPRVQLLSLRDGRLIQDFSADLPALRRRLLPPDHPRHPALAGLVTVSSIVIGYPLA
jgi:hypothetical protein